MRMRKERARRTKGGEVDKRLESAWCPSAVVQRASKQKMFGSEKAGVSETFRKANSHLTQPNKDGNRTTMLRQLLIGAEIVISL